MHLQATCEKIQDEQRGKGFTIVDTLDLGVALCHQSCLVLNDHTVCILLVLEDPFGPNYIVFLRWPWH